MRPNKSRHVLDLRSAKSDYDDTTSKNNRFNRAKEIDYGDDKIGLDDNVVSNERVYSQKHEDKTARQVYASSHKDLRGGESEFSRVLSGIVERHRTLGTLFFSAIAFVGWLFEQMVFGVVSVFKLVRYIITSPITALNALLDALARYVSSFIKYFSILIRDGLRAVVEIRISPPREWYRQVAVFSFIALILILPLKFSEAGVKLFEAKERVLGSTTTAIKYATLSQALKDYVPAIAIAKEFAGFNGPRRFLIVSQNNAELRATGGFMGWYGVLDIYNGKITAFETPDGGFYDLKGSITRQIEAPEPFHIFSPYWQVWNTNWFADYPTSARKLSKFYEISGGSTVDGVIMITPNIIEDILELTGPIELEEYDQIIDSRNFRTETQKEVEIEYDREKNTPKAFINDLMPEFAIRILKMINDGNVKPLLELVDNAFMEKHLLLYSANEQIQNTIESLDWGGKLHDSPQDYLSIVHTNIGGGKTDIAIKDLISVESVIENDGRVINTVRITRNHEGDPNDPFEGQNNLDYMRFYVPLGSKLLSADGFTTDDLTERYKKTDEKLEQDEDLESIKNSTKFYPNMYASSYEETGKTVFAGWLGLKPGQKKTVTIKYELPEKFDSSKAYSLYFQKQSGTQGTPIRVTVTLPENMIYKNWLPQSPNLKILGEKKLVYTNNLSIDRTISFTVSGKDD